MPTGLAIAGTGRIHGARGKVRGTAPASWLIVDAGPCPVYATCPCVLIATAHPVMRRLILELLNRERACWTASLVADEFEDAARYVHPDLVIVDGADFRRMASGSLAGYPTNRIVVIGQEPDLAYRDAALRHGAGAWVACDDLADQLSPAIRSALGCSHGQCPRFAD